MMDVHFSLIRMLILIHVVYFLALSIISSVEAGPATSCPANVIVFVADTTSQCIYHQCSLGIVTLTLRCRPGTVVPRRLSFTTNLASMCRPSVQRYACSRESRDDYRYRNVPVTGEKVVASSFETTNEIKNVAKPMPKIEKEEKVEIVKEEEKDERIIKQDATNQEKKSASSGQKQSANQNADAEMTTITPLDTSGFSVHIENYHILDGQLISREVTIQQCLDLCSNSAGCLGVDYTRMGGLCYQHQRDTICNMARNLPGTVHFKKMDCRSASSNVREIYPGRHILGGFSYCSDCSLDACLTACKDHRRCIGADYDTQYSTCHLHLPLTGCRRLLEKESCTHFKTTSCVSPPKLEFRPPPQGGQVNSNMPSMFNPIIYTCPHACVPPTDARDEYGALFLPERRPGPSVLPSGWAAYPAARIGTGTLMRTDRTGNGCFAMCDSLPTCEGVDFDSDTGFCYVYDKSNICHDLIVEDSPRYYHVKKLPCSNQKYNPIKCACA